VRIDYNGVGQGHDELVEKDGKMVGVLAFVSVGWAVGGHWGLALGCDVSAAGQQLAAARDASRLVACCAE